MVRAAVLIVAFAVASVFPVVVDAAVTTYDSQGTVLVDGVKAFPIALSKGPPLDGTTPSGAGALDEVIQAGVDFLKIGPATTSWNDAEIADAERWDAAAAARGAYTWVNLRAGGPVLGVRRWIRVSGQENFQAFLDESAAWGAASAERV
jgi:hypothetical protein